MATIYNSDLSKEIQEGAKTQIRDKIPNEIAEKVVPVMEVNPKLLRRINIIRTVEHTATGSSTIYTSPTDREFYLVAATLSITKDVACDNAVVYLNITPEGSSEVAIITLENQTLTAGSYNMVVTLPIPIKISKATNLRILGNKAAGNFVKSGTIFGYTVENINA